MRTSLGGSILPAQVHHKGCNAFDTGSGNCCAVRGHIDDDPSVADDCHTADWRAKYFVQRLTNSLTGLTEVSSPQATSSLLGMASSTSSINTIFVIVRDAISYQHTLLASHASS